MLLSQPNAKLKKHGIYSFGLPPVKTCPMAGQCKKYCYASKGCYRFKAPINKRVINFEASQSKYFETLINHDIAQAKVKTLRIHDSGDFYSQSYLDKWINIMHTNPNTYFYFYTKSLHLDFSKLPSNCKMIQSYGGKLDDKIDTSKPHAKIFSELGFMPKEYKDCSNNDLLASSQSVIHVGLIAH